MATPTPGDNPGDNAIDDDGDAESDLDPRRRRPKRDTRSGRPERITTRPKGVDKKTRVAASWAERITQQYNSGREKLDAGFKARYTDWFDRDLCGGFTDPGASLRDYAVLTRKLDRAFESANSLNIKSEAKDFFEGVILSHMDDLETNYAS